MARPDAVAAGLATGAPRLPLVRPAPLGVRDMPGIMALGVRDMVKIMALRIRDIYQDNEQLGKATELAMYVASEDTGYPHPLVLSLEPKGTQRFLELTATENSV